jgi:flavin-dependent dehydrogenase
VLVGDAAGAVSPLTAGGLDGALRLSSFAADVIAAYFDSGDPKLLGQYTGDRFRARFIARRWMRQTMKTMTTPLVAEAALAMLRLPGFRGMVEHVFFSRGSFPEMKLELAASRA